MLIFKVHIQIKICLNKSDNYRPFVEIHLYNQKFYNIQLEMLSNKFNKNNVLNTNDMDSLINHFINNFSKNDSKTIHANIWKRIIKCVDKLIS